MSRLRVALPVVAYSLCAWVAAAESWTLERVVDLALAQNPGLKAIEERRSEVAGGVQEAKADAFPQVAFASSWSRSRNPSLLNSPDFEDIIGSIPDFDFVPREQELWGLGFDVSQPLYTSGKVGAAVDLARLVEDAAEAQIAIARLDTAAAAAEAFFRLFEAREGLETVEVQRQARLESLAVVEARYELGEATRLELLQSRASVAQLEPLLDAARGLVEVAGIRLVAVLGLRERPTFELEAVDEVLAEIPSRERALAVAFERRPEFADLDFQEQALAKQARVTRADGLPQFDLNGVYGRTSRLPENLTDPLFQDWFLGVGMRWEFFDGGRRRGRVAQIESQREQLRWQIEELRTRVEQEVLEALTGYQTALSTLAAAEISVEAAREASRVARESYDEGVALQADFLAAQEREIQAEVTRVQAFYGAKVRAALLARALGFRADEPWTVAREEGT